MALPLLLFGLMGAPTPAKPTGLTATPGDGEMTLTWNDPSNSSITEYEYAQWTGSEPGTLTWNDISGSGENTTTHTVTGLDNGTT